jgi:hypothetical protein
LAMETNRMGRTAINAWLPAQMMAELLAIPSASMLAGLACCAAVGALALPGREVAYALLVLVVPFLTMWLVVRPFFLYPRFFLFVMPLIATFMAVGVVASIRTLAHAQGVRWLFTAPVNVVCLVAASWIGWTWLQIDRPPPGEIGYREILARSPDWTASATAVVGADSAMFDFYLRGPPPTLVFNRQRLDEVLRGADPVFVVYHDVPWNLPEDLVIRSRLEERCLDNPRNDLIVFLCR